MVYKPKSNADALKYTARIRAADDLYRIMMDLAPTVEARSSIRTFKVEIQNDLRRELITHDEAIKLLVAALHSGINCGGWPGKE